MESLRHQRSPGSTRFLGLFSSSNDSSAAAGGGGGVELHEDEVLWTTTAADPAESSVQPLSTANHNPSPFASPSSRASFRRTPDRSFGILAALPEDEGNRSRDLGSSGGGGGIARPLLQRKPSLPSASSSNSNSPASSSSSTAARMIPAVPKPKPEYSLSVPSGRILQPQSAPVNVPLMPRRARMAVEEALDEVGDHGHSDEDEMLPPHEIVARTYAQSPMTTFSVLEGAGRTLKGRDLRQVRNAVLRQTGFLD